ncbi:hypothetical protein PLESTB_000692700 [Pleodorina starrii]|uniref:ubiquitinyl hydrolase 1 n=1 Tax=Pleodorina starrii TaxID=330485 RepID=A0A9W6BJX5_9CHLO|nr:hypothetical protein PLESTM_001224500 [Pleodorina starrii]GLC52957.1 hypothetical protein PLESTB_000692700 [Pleodorina starrii]GLC65253.1 hypothetical protein PLESTF_000269000 [Pleodorina starrii]
MEDEQQLYEPVGDDMDAEESGPQVQPVNEDPSVAANNAKAMEAEYSGSYEWELPMFVKMTERQVSETFEIGTYLWRMLCFPRQNTPPHRHVSLFLEYPEAQYTPPNLSPKASFKLIIKNHKDPAKDYMKDTLHHFTMDQVDWGFSQTLPLTDVSVASGYLREDGAMVVRVEITIQRDERYLYDSRIETGYVGLKNQGATCYMNSLLQCLFNVPYFRKAVYHMPVPENEEPSKSLPVALQSLFYRLQYARGPVSTKELTKSFGWNTYDAFMQHDVQELNRVLCEKLEEKMKNTKVEKAINELFEGHTYNFIECINVSYKSTRKESFMDLQLDVKGCRTIYDSFDKYTEVEVLNGANQYKTDDYGMQDARKGILFDSFPPVLQLQLKRFEYDCQRDAMVKINDRYEFYDELDLDQDDFKYLSPNADRSVRNMYKLHSVLVHSGGVHGGHYYAFIRPDGKTWLRFDDDRVSREDQRNALDMQYGGGDEDMSGTGPYQQQPMPLKYAKFSNAYMLVYVRQSDWGTVMCDVTKDDIAKHLLDRLEREMSDKEARHRDKMEAHLYCSLKVATDEDFRQQVGDVSHFDLVDHDRLPPERCHYRMRKQTKFSEFKAEVARRTGIPPERQRYWTWKRRNNGTCRPERPLTEQEEASQLVDLKDIRDLPREGHGGGGGGGGGGAGAKKSLMDIRLYLEALPEDANDDVRVEANAKSGNNVLLFAKYYDPLAQTLSFRAHHVLPTNATVSDVGRLLLEEQEMPADTPTLLFEEVKFEPTVMVEKLLAGKQLKDHELQHGDVIIYQRALSADQAAKLAYPTADKYLAYIHNRRQVHFKKLEEPQAPPAVTLELLRSTTYDEMCQALASVLGLDDPTKLRITRHNYFSSAPQRTPIKWRSVASLEQLLTHQQHPTDIIYYEVLDLPLHEMEQLKTVKVSFHNGRGEFVGEQHSLRLRKEASVADLLAELAGRLVQAAAAAAPSSRATSQSGASAAAPDAAAAPDRASQGGGGAAADDASLKAAAALAAAGRPMRLLEMLSGKIYKVIDPSDRVDTLNDSYWQLRAEFVPEEQLAANLGPGDFLVHVAHQLLPPLPQAAAAYWAAQQNQQQGGGEATEGGGAQGRGGGISGGVAPMDAEDEEEEQEEEATTRGSAGARAFRKALIEQMPGAPFGDPLIVRVRGHETMGQLRAKIQALLGTPPEEFARWPVLFVGTRPNNAWLPDSEDLTTYFGGHQNQFAGSATAAAAGPTDATLVDPARLMVVVLHEDRGGGAARRQPPSNSRYAYEKPVKIYA